MVDVQTIKETIDCREIVERDLGEPKYRHSRYSVWKCPLHNERKGYSLTVWADSWKCWGACQTGGDVITWVQQYHNMSFREACEFLDSSGQTTTWFDRTPSRKQPQKNASAKPPETAWQRSALAVVKHAEATLWSLAGQKAMRYLKDRGLSDAIIKQARLGYIPGSPQSFSYVAGIRVPCGITIPWFADGALWAVKLRIAAGSPKYRQISGGNANGLYWADYLQRGRPTLITEGEFDCLIAWQCASDIICPVALGSASNTLGYRWIERLVFSPTILVRLDEDVAGNKASERLQALSHRLKFIRVPRSKDINEYFLSEGSVGASADRVADWLSNELEE